jgi:hypothetical protein
MTQAGNGFAPARHGAQYSHPARLGAQHSYPARPGAQYPHAARLGAQDSYPARLSAQHPQPARGGAQLARLVNLAAAVTSVALLAGAAWWGYRLAVLDVSGLPVLRAAEGPMRVAPADPGGQIALHTGLAVNTVVATGRTEPVAERVVLAPPPATLAPEDVLPATVPAAAPPAAALETAALAPPAPAETAAPAEAAAAPLPATDPDAAMDAAVARALSGIALELAGTDGGPGLLRSPRPRLRPASAAAAADDALGLARVQTVAARLTAELDPAAIRPGTRLAQLGAFDDAATARAEWDRIAARLGGLMEGKSRILQPATSAGRDFVRLRAASFASEDDARRFCAAVEAAIGSRCIPVTQR